MLYAVYIYCEIDIKRACVSWLFCQRRCDGRHHAKTERMTIGTLALTGFPLTAGFYSKDAIIEAAFVGQNSAAGYAFFMVVIAALFTSFYSWRLVFMTFFGKPRASVDVMKHVHESPYVMTIPLMILALGALFAGIAFQEYFIGHEVENFFRNSLFTLDTNHVLHDLHEVPLWVKESPLVMMVLGFITAWLLYIRWPHVPAQLAARHHLLYQFLLNKWYFDELYDLIFVRPAKWIGYQLWKKGDGRIIDGLGPDGIAARVRDITGQFVRLQTGYVYHYAFAMMIGVALFITWMMFYGGGAH